MPVATQTKVSQRFGIAGVEDLLAAVAAVPEAVRMELVVPVVRAGGKVVKEGAKFLAPVEEGDLRDSIEQVEVRYPQTYSAISVVGPERGYKGNAGKKPTKYAHLVEFGHIIGTKGIRKGKATNNFIGPKPGATGGFVPPKPFMRPAVETAATFALEPMFQAAEKAFDAIGAKLERKYGHKKTA